jgi:Fe-S cluster assembly protein SufD
MVTTIAVKETRFTEQFSEFIKGKTDAADRARREEAFAFFATNGFPTVREEDWKYTNVSPLANEEWRVSSMPAAVDVSSVEIPQLDFRRNGFTALNAAFADVTEIRISKDTAFEEPIELDLVGEEGSGRFPHFVVIAEAGSKATIVERYTGPSKATRNFTNSIVRFVIYDNASITHYRVQKESPSAFHYGLTEVTLGRGSSYDSTSIDLGAALSRHDTEVKFTAEGGEAWVDGLYMLNGSQHHDTHSVIDHAVKNCVSHQTYKGVLNDGSRAVFNGKVFVRENASGTDAQQSNKNLLLSNDARVDTKPQLEIFNDDVKCSHGATVGQLEEEELFYLLARGLPETLARNLLTYGFAEEVINKIAIDSIKDDLDKMVLNRLSAEMEL